MTLANIWTDILFCVSIVAIILLISLCLISRISSSFNFFPPPKRRSWQSLAFISLFRLYLYPLIVLSFVNFEPVSGTRALVQYGFGILSLIFGFGLAFRITFNMGWRNAFGEKEGLKTNGWFSRSRNPVYVSSWIGMIGWALLANNIQVTLLLTVWAFAYCLAPLIEEPWLEQQYGESYLIYKSKTPRFF